MEWIILQWTRVWYNNDLYQQAILESTMVTNLDTGEVIPLSAAEERIPQGHGWSPLSEHLIRRAKELSEVLVTLCMPHPSVCMYVCVCLAVRDSQGPLMMTTMHLTGEKYAKRVS